MDTNQEDMKFTLRLPKELDDAINNEAQNEKRSKNSQIIIAIETYLEKRKSQKPETVSV